MEKAIIYRIFQKNKEVITLIKMSVGQSSGNITHTLE